MNGAAPCAMDRNESVAVADKEITRAFVLTAGSAARAMGGELVAAESGGPVAEDGC